MEDLLILIGMTLVTFLPRALPLALANKIRLSVSTQRVLSYVPIAVLSVIISQTVLFRDNTLLVTVENPHIWALVTAIFFSLIQKSLMLTIAVGMLSYFLARWLIGL